MQKSDLLYSSEPSITLGMLIEKGILKSGTTVVSSQDESITGILNEDGSISLKLNGVIRTFPFPSGAARAVALRSLNGWTYWHTVINGKRESLSIHRDKYISLFKK